MARTREWRPDVAITDFEPLTAAYARYSRTPLVAVDNINMLDRCHHDAEIVGAQREDFMIAKAVTHSMVPGAVEYVVTTFFEPPLARACTTLVPPIVRPEVENAESERGEHLVVYASGDPNLLDALRSSGCRAASTGCGAARRPTRSTGTSSTARAPATASSRICAPRGGWSRAAASRCSARPSTSASRCSRSRFADSSSS